MASTTALDAANDAVAAQYSASAVDSVTVFSDSSAASSAGESDWSGPIGKCFQSSNGKSSNLFHQVIKRRPIHPLAITSKPEANTAWDPAGRFSALRVASDSDSAMVQAASYAAVNEFRRWYTRIISVRCSEAEGQRSSTYFPKDFKSPIAMLISLSRLADTADVLRPYLSRLVHYSCLTGLSHAH